MKIKLLKYRLEIGILISLFGIQYSRIFMEIFSIPFNTTNVIFVIGLILVLNPSKLVQLKVPLLNNTMILILVYQILVLIAAFIANASLFNGLSATVFTWFSLFYIIFLCTNNTQNFNSEIFVKLGWISTGVCSFILVFLITNGFKNFSTVTGLTNGSDRLTLSVINFAFLIFNLVYRKVGVLEKIIGIIFCITAFIGVALLSRKGIMVSYVLILIIHVLQMKRKKINLSSLLKMLIIIVLGGMTLTVLFKAIPNLQNLITGYIESLIDGIYGYLGKSQGIYNTGAIRNNHIINMLDEYKTDFSLIEILFGKGYYYRQVDMPYLQAFTDMGIFIGIYYLIIQLIKPIQLIFFTKIENCAIMFIKYFSIVTIMQNIYSGSPYGHYKFVPIVTLVFLIYKSKMNSYSKLCLN